MTATPDTRERAEHVNESLDGKDRRRKKGARVRSQERKDEGVEPFSPIGGMAASVLALPKERENKGVWKKRCRILQGNPLPKKEEHKRKKPVGGGIPCISTREGKGGFLSYAA